MMLYRTLAALGVGIVGVFCTPWLLAPICIAYVLYFRKPYELVLMGAMLDAFFGMSVSLPYYTLAAVLLVGIAELIKPHLSIYSYVRT